MAEQVARITGTHTLDTLATKTKSLARLSPFRKSERGLAIECRRFNFAAQCRLGKRNRHFTMQIIAVALKHLMLLDVDFHIQIARRTTVHTRLAVAGRTNTHTVVYPFRDFHFQSLVTLETTGTSASRTWFRDDLAATVALGAGLLNAKKTLLHAHLAMPAASTAGGRCGAWLGARPVASITLIPGGHTNSGIKPVRSLLQANFKVVAQISTAIDLRTSATTATTATASAENVTKNIAKSIGKAACSTASATHIRVNAGMTVTVIGIELLRIRQHLVGFLALLELIFRTFAVGVAIRMVLHRQFAISLLDLVLGRIFRQT